MHKVSSENRTQSIKRVAEQISESEMIFKVTSEDFAENALYHSACITRYLLRNIKTEIKEPRLHISFQTVGRVDSFRETNGAAVHDIRHTLPLLTLNNDSITKVFLQLLLKPIL
jgi:hypothetical protein